MINKLAENERYLVHRHKELEIANPDRCLGIGNNALMSDHDDALRYAEGAGQILLALRASSTNTGRSWALGDHGDVNANIYLLDQIANDHPSDCVLSEESADTSARLDADRVWIIDPLDGTREFSEPGRSDWAVHVALWERDRGLTAGAVTLPALSQGFVTNPPSVVPSDPDRPRRVVVSRSRPPAAARRVADAIDAEVVTLGSAGAKVMAVVSGLVDAYVHTGGQYEWDSAAPIAVAAAAGLHTSRVDGSPMLYNRPDPWLPDLIVCRPEFAERALEAINF